VQNTLSDPGSRVFSCNAAQKSSTVTDTGRRCASRLFRDSELVLAMRFHKTISFTLGQVTFGS
jgi:hypothetical protein